MDFTVPIKQSPNQWIMELVGRVFYHKREESDPYYRSIYITSSLQPKISKRLLGEPPSEAEPITASNWNKLLRLMVSSTV